MAKKYRMEKVYTLAELQTKFFEHTYTHKITRNSLTEQVLMMNSEMIDLMMFQLIVQLRISSTPSFTSLWGSSAVRQLMEMRLIAFRKLTEAHHENDLKLHTQCFRHFFYEVRKTITESNVQAIVSELEAQVIENYQKNEYLINKYIVHASSSYSRNAADDTGTRIDIRQIWQGVLTINRVFLRARSLVYPEASISLTVSDMPLHVQDMKRIFFLKDEEVSAVNTLLERCRSILDVVRNVNEQGNRVWHE